MPLKLGKRASNAASGRAGTELGKGTTVTLRERRLSLRKAVF